MQRWIIPSLLSYMAFKFEKLEIWQLSMSLTEKVYEIIEKMPEHEKFNLASQIRRAVTSIPLNIAEGSTSQTDPEQLRFLGYSHRSLMEVVSCIMLMEKHNYLEQELYVELYSFCEKLSAKILAMRNAIKRRSSESDIVKEPIENYGIE